MNMYLAVFFLGVFWFQLVTAQNDLNLALQLLISEMNSDGFFLDAWTIHHKSLPIPVPNECSIGMLTPRDNADESLSSVLDSGILRVGLAKLAAGYPAYYSKSVNATDPTDIDAGDLDGYEIYCAKEAARRLGEAYSVNVEPEFIVIHGDTYFEPLRDALNDEIIDVTWTAMFPTDERAAEIDFTCPTFLTEQVIGAGAGVGERRPRSSENPLDVACVRGFCELDLPPPFVMRRMIPETTDEVYGALLRPDDGIKYAVYTFEQLGLFFQESCPNCTFVDMAPLDIIVRLPATKKTERKSSSSLEADNAKKSSSWRLLVSKIVMILSLTSLAVCF